jgi:outer membrane protein OmpA-like peptidoglycan-associated protein/opacity protein-like surface antigen
MVQTFRRGSRTALALIVGICSLVGASRAQAGDNEEGVKVELGLTGGYHWFAQDLELGAPDDPHSSSPKNSATFGLRVGLLLHPMFEIEGEALLMPTSDNHSGGSVLVSAERIHARYNIAPGLIADGKLTPFILAGIGFSSTLTSDAGGGGDAGSAAPGPHQFQVHSGDNDVNYYLGAGARYALNNFVHVRLDGRLLWCPNITYNGLSRDYELTAGVGITLGGHPATPPPPPPPPLVKDTDGDGIPDNVDKCPNEAGPKENGGCPDKDTDKDGVVDRLDKCPDKAGPPERQGCPVEDADNDGIPDNVDKCPNDPEDKDGFEDADGCPDPDNDKDGILDKDDKCPNEPETKNGYQDEDGCPDEVPAQVKQFSGVVGGINFRRNSADIKASSFPTLKKAVQVFKEYQALRVEISGHTSNEGKREFNMKLSRKRALAVKEFLVSAGIDENRIGTVGYGPDKPIADNDTKEGQEKNRRIEFRLLSAKESISNQAEPEDINPSPDRKHPKKEKPAKGESGEKPAKEKKAKADKGDDKPTDAADKPAKKKKKKEAAPDDEPMPK